ncbi:MAG TPA: hypothetical protein VI138_00820 [Candidatus Dormibacteraeota bacterium]
MRALLGWRDLMLGRGRPGPPAADRLLLLAVALLALRFANWQWLSDRIPGRGAALVNDGIEFGSYLLFVALVALACRGRLPPRIRRWRPGRALLLAPAVFLILTAAVSLSVVRSLPAAQGRVDDANAMAVCGAQAISSGHDPYRVKEIACLERLGIPATLATPLRKGPLAGIDTYPTPAEIEMAALAASHHGGTQTLFSGLAKPPLDPAVMLPVAHSSPQDRALWTLLFAVAFAVLLALAAGSLWPAALAAFLATYYIPGSALAFASVGNAESVAYLLMAVAVLWIRRPVPSGVCLGLAIASNELALFFLPAYLLICLRLDGGLRRVIALVLTAALGIVPWVVVFPDAVPAIWHNLTSPTFALGYGPVLLVLQGVIRNPRPDLFLGATGICMVLILLWGWLRPVWRISAGVLLIAAFWLSWRSLDEYMAQVPLLALVAILALLRDRDQTKTAEQRQPEVQERAAGTGAVG